MPARRPSIGHGYGRDVEEVVGNLASVLTTVAGDSRLHGLDGRALAIAMLEEDAELLGEIKEQPWGREALQAALTASDELASRHGEQSLIRLALERHGLAGPTKCNLSSEKTTSR